MQYLPRLFFSCCVPLCYFSLSLFYCFLFSVKFCSIKFHCFSTLIVALLLQSVYLNLEYSYLCTNDYVYFSFSIHKITFSTAFHIPFYSIPMIIQIPYLNMEPLQYFDPKWKKKLLAFVFYSSNSFCSSIQQFHFQKPIVLAILLTFNFSCRLKYASL